MTLLKICGITREEDARFCAEAGVDFIGLVFVPGSPRRIDTARAARIAASVAGRGPRLVGVFRNAPVAEVRQIAHRLPLDFVQLHGAESDDEVAAVGIPVIRSIGVGAAAPDPAVAPHATWLLYDTLDDRGGGTGRAFDWRLLAGCARGRPFFLAGGLTPKNVAEAVRAVRPDAVDVSSGVESAPGIKDHDRIRAVIGKVRA